MTMLESFGTALPNEFRMFCSRHDSCSSCEIAQRKADRFLLNPNLPTGQNTEYEPCIAVFAEMEREAETTNRKEP